jgi:hypothetical protein
LSTMPPGREALVFIHLSDIHLRAGPDRIDPNHDIRRRLGVDVEELSRKYGPITGTLIGGDVAYSGAETEYARAKDWLKQLCARLGCPSEDVWMVPGNHDVDIARHSAEFLELQSAMRSCPPNRAGDELAKALNSDKAAHLFAPLENYINFATAYGCEITPSSPYWSEPFLMEDGIVIWLHGLTSTLISSLADSEGDNKLVLGEFQAQFDDSSPNSVHLAICHHPPPWLRDWDQVENYLDVRCSLQLFGHRHIPNQLLRGRTSLRISAGALHPERGEGWQPAYNFIIIRILNRPDGRFLEVTVRPRAWRRETTAFGPDFTAEGADSFSYELPLRPLSHDIPAGVSEKSATAVNSPQESYEPQAVRQQSRETGTLIVKSRSRRLVYEYSNLPTWEQARIATELGLVSAEEGRLPSRELVPLVFSRVKARSLFPDLWERVAAISRITGPNPYKEST